MIYCTSIYCHSVLQLRNLDGFNYILNLGFHKSCHQLDWNLPWGSREKFSSKFLQADRRIQFLMVVELKSSICLMAICQGHLSAFRGHPHPLHWARENIFQTEVQLTHWISDFFFNQLEKFSVFKEIKWLGPLNYSLR